MSLTSALNVAQSSLSAVSTHSQILSRNVAGASDAYYHRKNVQQSTNFDGTVRINGIGRAMDAVLFAGKLGATSTTATQQAIVDALEQLEATVNDPELDQSLGAKLGALTNALQEFGVTPDDPILAQAVLSKAGELARSLNESSQVVSNVREEAHDKMTSGVTQVNKLLKQFEEVNTAIVKGTHAGSDITDQLDKRDQILSQLSQEMGISVQTRASNDMVIYTDSGVTLFETVPRTVAMGPASALPLDKAVYVDGVPVTGPNAIMPLKSGEIYGASVVRDQITVTYQRQLDEIARGLVEVFAESDQSTPATLPDQAGLFIDGADFGVPQVPPLPPAPGLPIPTMGADSVGLAARIRINPNADPSQGGDLDMLRDGGLAGAAYSYNPGPNAPAAYSGRIQEMLTKLGEERTFDASAEADPTNSLSGFTSSSVGWLEGKRQVADDALGFETARLDRTTDALSNATGVNVNDEMTLLMELERSYNASSMILTTIDRMINSLLSATGAR